MACSLAQIESNRRNALRSTGPRTEEGKARSRRNGLKHGLTGAGVVLPTEDLDEVERRFEALESELKPASEAAFLLLKRVALATLKLDRSAEGEARTIAFRMRQARAEFDDARLAQVENYYSWLAAEPATNARRLRSTPEGLDRLLSALRALRGDVAHPEGTRWGWQQGDHLHHLLGRRRTDVPASRAHALGEAVDGKFEHLDRADGAGLDDLPRRCWAARALVALIDDEIAALEAHRSTLDLAGLALDRDEAPLRAMFDPGPAATLARKYEAAIERTLFRTLREFREVQPGPLPDPAAEPGPAPGLGSSLPGAPAAALPEAEVPPEPPPEVAPGLEKPRRPDSTTPIDARESPVRRSEPGRPTRPRPGAGPKARGGESELDGMRRPGDPAAAIARVKPSALPPHSCRPTDRPIASQRGPDLA